MPHAFVNRPRLHDLRSAREDVAAQLRWESINAVLYEIGGVVFIVGSVLFFPRFEPYADLGAWTFFFGSLLYLVVTGHDLAETIRFRLTRAGRPLGEDFELVGGNVELVGGNFELVAAVAYLIGTVLFTVGSLFFLSRIGWVAAGAWCFVTGSLLFVLGAYINVLQILTASSLTMLQLMNLTAISFVVGSVLFTVASVPYLWKIAPEDRALLYGFLAWQYLIGSVLFLAGGIFNHRRAYLVGAGARKR